jgi:WD40 repeat protein
MKIAFAPIMLFVALLLSPVSFAFELRPQLGHTLFVNAVAYSADGLYIASASSDQTIKLWEVSSGKEVRTFKGHSGEVMSVAFSPDSKYLASAGDQTVRLWEISTGKEIRVFKGHTGNVTSVVFSPDGKSLASTSKDKTIKLWNISGSEGPCSFIGHTDTVTSVAFSPAAGFLISGSSDKTINYWQIKGCVLFYTATGHSQAITSVAYSPDAQYIASTSKDKSIKLWDAVSKKELFSFTGHTDTVTSVAFNPESTLLASSSADQTLRIWDIKTKKEIRTLKAKLNWVLHLGINSVAFSPDGLYLASGSEDQTVRLWEVSSGKELHSSVNTGVIGLVAYSPSGKYLAVAGADYTVKLWDLNSARSFQTFAGHTDTVESVAYSLDGKYLASGSDDKTIKLWAIRGAGIFTGKEIRTLTGHAAFVMSVAFSPDGKYLVSSSGDKTIKLWEVKTGKELLTLTGHTKAVPCVAFSPNGKYLASASYDTFIKFWEVPSGKELLSFKGDTYGVTSLSFSPDGKYLASAGAEGSIKLWEASTGKELRSFVGHASIVTGVRFSPDGQYLCSAGFADRSVRLWEVSTGKELHSFLGHSSYVLSVAYSPDGKYLASSSADGTTRLWRVDTGESMAMIASVDGEWMIFTDDGYFDSSPGGLELIAVVDGLHGYNIDQLALKYNRPDLILKRMELGAPDVIEYYYKRYLNRLKKAKIESEAQLDGSFENLPKSAITDTKVNEQDAEVSITLEDKAGLTFYQVYVNGVALYDGFGKDVSGTKLSFTEKFKLTQGENRIEVSALNTGGQESFRALSIVKGPEKLRRELYFVGFGVSAYTDKDIPDLVYANKDAKELSEAFDKLQGYDDKHILPFVNEKVTKASIKEAKELFKKAKPQDTVVLFIAGHGIHDRDALATYYYIIGDTQIDVSKEGLITIKTETAVSFEEIESLLSGIDAKQKLFLMDTCESGEREEIESSFGITGASAQSLKARAIGVSKVTPKKKSPKKAPQVVLKSSARPWLLDRDRYIYQDLAKRTGAIVFSSSKGAEYSYESKKLENGLFTDAILEGLSQKAADDNKDGSISTDELKKYVTQDVATLSSDLQHPTIDRNNLYLKLSFVP